MTSETPTNTNADANADKRAQLAKLTADRDAMAIAVEQIKAAVGVDSVGYVRINENYQALVSSVEKLTATIERDERNAKLAKFTQPIIDAFGSFTVTDPTGLPNSIGVTDLVTVVAKANEAITRAQNTIKIANRLEKAIEKSGLNLDEADGLRDFKVIVDGTTVKLAVATRAGRTAGSGSGGGRGQRYEIVKANDPALVGKTVGGSADTYGSDPDFKSWRDLFAHVDDAAFKIAEEKRANGSNYSAHDAAVKAGGIEDRAVDAPESAD